MYVYIYIYIYREREIYIHTYEHISLSLSIYIYIYIYEQDRVEVHRGLRRRLHVRPRAEPDGALHSAKGGAVETGCSHL